jgi:hypothetical protein
MRASPLSHVSKARDVGHPAMGGQLKIEAVFPEGKVEINQFRKLGRAAGAD